MAEASKREEVLREENNFLKLPKAARRRKIDQDSRLKRKQIDKLKNVLHGQQGNLFYIYKRFVFLCRRIA